MRPTIYIGLGGTGIRAISQTKKLYEDSYGVGQIPTHIAFLVMDFDLADIDNPNLPTPMGDDAVHINYSGSPRNHYAQHASKGDFPWMFDGNAHSLSHKITDGSGTMRTTGRFYTECSINSIETALVLCWHKITQTTYTEEADVCIVMSLAGGTGAGSFINIAEMVHRNYGKRAHIIGYGVLHGVFRAMDPLGVHTPKARENAYSSIVDLDYLMSASLVNPIKFEINGSVRELTSPIFHEFFVIDNVTASGNIIPTIEALCEAVGFCLFASSGDMGSAIQGGHNNNRWQGGNYDILNKKGWVQTLGGCQIVYKGDLLADIYGSKAAIELIRKMRLEGNGIEKVVTDWMDEVRIRENDGCDLLIDSIYSPEKMNKLKNPMITIVDTVSEINAETNRYINTLVEFPTEKVLEAFKESKIEALGDKLNAIMSTECSIGDAKQFLVTLKSYLQICKQEMEQEATKLTQELNSKTQAVEGALKEYDEYSHRAFQAFRGGGREDRLNNVSSLAKSALKLSIEIKRREAARDIFTALIAKVADYELKVETIDQELEHLSREYSDNVAKKEREQSSSTFVYDISFNERFNMPFYSEDIGIAGFVASLTKSLLDMDVYYELKPTIDDYVATLPKAVAYREVSITDVIEELPYDEYENIIKFIKSRSSCLLRINDRGLMSNEGHTPREMITNHLFLSIYRKNEHYNNERIERLWQGLRIVEQDCCVDFTYSTLDTLKQKILIYRENCSVIPYCIDAFDDMVVDEYEQQIKDSMMPGSTEFNPHFDKILFEEMRKQNFKLKPKSAESKACNAPIVGNIKIKSRLLRG